MLPKGDGDSPEKPGRSFFRDNQSKFSTYDEKLPIRNPLYFSQKSSGAYHANLQER